jgi:hypothetical protein
LTAIADEDSGIGVGLAVGTAVALVSTGGSAWGAEGVAGAAVPQATISNSKAIVPKEAMWESWRIGRIVLSYFILIRIVLILVSIFYRKQTFNDVIRDQRVFLHIFGRST